MFPYTTIPTIDTGNLITVNSMFTVVVQFFCSNGHFSAVTAG